MHNASNQRERQKCNGQAEKSTKFCPVDESELIKDQSEKIDRGQAESRQSDKIPRVKQKCSGQAENRAELCSAAETEQMRYQTEKRAELYPAAGT